MSFKIEPIGYIRSPWAERKNMPIQPTGAVGVEGKVVMKEEFKLGIKDLDGFSYMYLIYFFDRSVDVPKKMTVMPFCDPTNVGRGVFSTRCPVRPNNLGMSLVKIKRVENNEIYFDGVDVLDNTPLIDIKPFIPQFEKNVKQENAKTGWFKLETKQVEKKRSDERFIVKKDL